MHVVDATGRLDERHNPVSYVSLFSTTPGNLNKEVEQIDESFVCGRDKTVDFVTFSVKYGCWTYNDTTSGWSEADIPTMHVDSDAKENGRVTQVSIDTKDSVRWVLAINTEEIEDFKLKGNQVFFVNNHIYSFSLYEPCLLIICSYKIFIYFDVSETKWHR